MTRYMKRGGKIWINIFPHQSLTKIPLETRMGKGKGQPEVWVAVVKKNKIMFEVAGVSEEVAKALSHLKAVAVLDKSDSLNAIGGALFEDVVSSMYVAKQNVPVVNYVYGIGGRDTTEKEINSVYADLAEIAKDGKVENPYRYLGLRSNMKGGK